MQPISFHLRECVAQGLLEASPIRDVYWTPSIARTVARARTSPNTNLTIGLGDFFVGSYSALKQAKSAVQALAPGTWTGSEIHHIVENFHLQFLGAIDPISNRTYEHFEPCVLLGKKHHDTHIDSIVGGAETLILEVAGRVDFPAAFREDTPGVSKLSLSDAAVRRAEWVKTQELRPGKSVTGAKIQRWLVEMYRFAYQEQELRPLQFIALSVLRSMPVTSLSPASP